MLKYYQEIITKSYNELDFEGCLERDKSIKDEVEPMHIVKMFKNISIKWKYMIYSIIIIIPFIITIYIIFYRMMNILKDNNSRYTVQIMMQVKNNIEVMLREIDNISIDVAEDAKVKQLLESGGTDRVLVKSVNKRLSDMADRVGQYRNLSVDILVVTKDMYIASSTYKKWIGNYKLLSSGWVGNILNASGDKVLVSAYNVFKDDQPKSEKVICLSRGVMDGDQMLGIIMIEVNLQYLDSICKGVGLGEKGFIAVLNQSNQVFYHTNKSEIGSFLDVEILKKTKNREYYIGELAGEKMLVTNMYSPAFGLMITGIIPLSEIDKNIQSLRYIAVSSGVGLTLLLLFIFYTVVYGVTKPIIRIKNQMASVENGNFNIKILSDRNDEIGQLEKGFNIMVKKINDLIETVYKVEIKQKEAQYNELCSKVNPHFLYNTLDAISMTAYLNNDHKIVTMINALAEYFRASTTKGQWLITINEEIEQLKNYLYLITIGKENRIKVTWDIDATLLSYKTIRFILQPIVENSIIHGFKDRENDCTLYIAVYEKISSIVFKVVDNGVGIPEEKLAILAQELTEPDSGQYVARIGLKNLNERIKLSFGVEYGLNIYGNETGGVTVEVNIPIMD